MTKIKGLPKNEIVWEKRITSGGNTYYITTKGNDRSIYYFYELKNGSAVKVGKSKSPLDIKKYIV